MEYRAIKSSSHRVIGPFGELIWNKKPGMVRRGHSDILTDALAPCLAWLQAVVQIATLNGTKDFSDPQPDATAP
jgi:hypothetical protein